MAIYAIICLDKPGVLDQRLAHRPDHLAYLQSQTTVKILVAGPQLDPEGKPCGSLLIVDAPDLAAAQAFSAADPFKQNGVFGDVQIRGYATTLGAWVS